VQIFISHYYSNRIGEPNQANPKKGGYELFGEQDTKLGKTLEAYRRISIALNSFPSAERVSIKELATKAQVHWNTAKKALLFFNILRPMVPQFRLESESKFRIIKKPSAVKAVEGIFESLEMRVVVKLMLKNALEEENALKAEEFLSEEEKQIVQELISKGFINSIEGHFYLSKRGQSLASIGMRKLIELGIDLPWEKPIEQIPFQITKERVDQPMHFRSHADIDISCREALESWRILQRLYQPGSSEENEGWQYSSQNKRALETNQIFWGDIYETT